MKNAIKFIASYSQNTSVISINDAKNQFILPNCRALACIGFWLCVLAFQTVGAATKPLQISSAAASNAVSSSTIDAVTLWTCNAFYLPARNIWQRTIAVIYRGDVVRSVQIDDVAVHTFTLEGNSLLTSVDGERIQFDVAALTWTSDLRGLANSTGRCTL